MRALTFTVRRALSTTPRTLGADPFPNYDYSEGPHPTVTGTLRGYPSHSKPEKFAAAGKNAGNESLFKFLVFDALKGSDKLDYWVMQPTKSDPRFQGSFQYDAFETNKNPLTDYSDRKARTGPTGYVVNGFVLMLIWGILMINPHWQPGKLIAGEDWRKHNINGW